MNILDEANKLTTRDRQDVYGHPYDDFRRVSELTSPIAQSTIDPRLKHALYMIQVKVARLLNSPYHHDSIVDIAGYANTYDMIVQEMTDRGEVIAHKESR